MELQTLIPASQCLVVSGHQSNLEWAFNYILSETKDQHFWSAILLDTHPRSAIALFPAAMEDATLFERGLDAVATAKGLEALM